MSKPPKNKVETVKCPLCEGRGELSKPDLYARLDEKDFCVKVKTYLQNVVDAETETEPVKAGTQPFEHDVNAWNCTHFLWRRSPKE